MVNVFIFILGLIFGVALTLVLQRPQRKLPSIAQPKPAINWRELFKLDPKPESKLSAVGSIPRATRGWRTRRQELQRDHNSTQKQRDSGLPAI